MRTAALTIVSFVAFGYAANAQKFSLLPQVGFENSKTSIHYNDRPSFSPTGINFSPQVGLKLDYSTKKGHGIFLGATSSRSIVRFSFTDPENGMTNYSGTTGNMQVRLETGYQFNSKPFYFKPGKSIGKTAENKVGEKKKCGSYSLKSHCLKNKPTSRDQANSDKQALPRGNKGGWVRFQPSAGIGFIPAVKTDMITKSQGGQTLYEYRAGNYNTAFTTGMGFEFGKNSTRLLSVSINYFKGIGNMDKQTLSTPVGAKIVTTTLQSEVSGWNMKFGIPLTLGVKKQAVKQRTDNKIQQPKAKCGQYRIMYRCNKAN